MNSKTNDYIVTKMDDIIKSTHLYSAYNLGLAQGYLVYYDACKEVFGIEKANESFDSIINGKEEVNAMFRELLKLNNADEPIIKQKHGKWFLLDECANEGVYCSVCHKKIYKTNYANQKLKSKYCPNCGAIMDEE